MANPFRVFISLNIPQPGIDMLRSAGMEVTVWENDTPPNAGELLNGIEAKDALLCTGMDTLDKAFFQKSGLKAISIFAAGYDNIDIAEASARNIPIGNTPGAMQDATADVAFGLMMAVSRKMFFMHKSILKNEWGHFRPRANLGMELKGRTLGIFGLGKIGLEMAKRCQGAYDMNVAYHNRSQNKEAERKLAAKWVGFEELLERSDVLSVHCALNQETKGIFNSDAFGKMKPTSIFINTSRGGVHNEKDLINALENRQIWGAGLDVTNPEPMAPDNPLLQMENVAITPHIGSATVQARDRMSIMAAENLIAFSQGNKMPYSVNF